MGGYLIGFPNPGNGPEVHGRGDGIKTMWSYNTDLEIGEGAAGAG